MLRTLCISTVIALSVTGCKSKPKTTPDDAKLARAEVPQLVRDAFHKDHPNVTLERVDPDVQANGDVHYAFKFIDAKGRKGEAEYNDKGKPWP